MNKWRKYFLFMMLVAMMIISVPASAKTKKVAAPKNLITQDRYISKDGKFHIKLHWDKVGKAKKYTIKAYNGKRCIASKSTKKTTYSITIPKKYKKVTIKVSANNSKTASKTIKRECWHMYEPAGYTGCYWIDKCIRCGHEIKGYRGPEHEWLPEGDYEYEE